MKTEKNILVAFILNLLFSIFEFIGGAITGSVAIISDAVHDVGDALSIGVACFLQHKSKKAPDEVYTYGYARLSVIGGLITTVILLFGSLAVIYNAIVRMFRPITIDYNGMIIFAVVGVLVNFVAALLTKEGDSINQKAVNLHMLEDVLGWIVVLIGAVLMHYTKIFIIDSIMSIGVAVFIFINATKNLKKIEDLFLEKTPSDIRIEEIKGCLCEVEGVIDVHHIHIWSMDGYSNRATMHIVTEEVGHEIKEKVRKELERYNIHHVTLELETPDEHCHSEVCSVDEHKKDCHHHHHH